MTKKYINEPDWINWLLWLVYILLLAVLLPHTAWAFSQFEPTEATTFGIPWGLVVAWFGALAFECTIAVMTHKLAKHIEATPKYNNGWVRFQRRYLNAYGGGLFIAWIVSSLANLAHSVQFGKEILIFAQWGIPAPVYSVAFGAILPTTSLLFAWVLSSVIEADASEGQANIDLEIANKTIRELRGSLRDGESQRIELENKLIEAKARFDAAGDLFVKLVQGPKEERILYAKQQWPELPQSSIAVITETSASYVSEVLNKTNGQHL